MVLRSIFVPLLVLGYLSTVSVAFLFVTDRRIVKSASDDNEYRAVTLSNGIQCVLVSDTLTDSAAVKLRVDVGFLAEDTPGLAHFLEHMLFHGSVQYPDGNIYQTFISEKGGWMNGYTTGSATAYLFKIPNEFWVPAARMMSSFVGSPLLPEDKFDSAIAAVDSEYKRGLKNDLSCLYAVALELANPENRYHPFGTGNEETLNVPDIRQQAIDFHNRFYSANLISLVVVANETLVRLESLAEEIFGSIPNNNKAMFLNPALPFPTEDRRYLSKNIYIKKKQPGDLLIYLFPINMNYPSTRYIKYLLNHEGKGSVYQYLVTRGYITSIMVDIAINDPQFIPFFVFCELTKKGLANPDFITETIFKYLKSACKDGVDVELWKAIKQVDELNFRFTTTKDPYSLAAKILGNMEETDDPRDYLGAPSRRVLDVEVENRVLSFLNPNNFNLYIASDTFSSTSATKYGPQLTKTEYFYNTAYLDISITENQLERWETVEEDADLHLPERNTFVPENFQIFPIEADAGEFPIEIRSGDEDDISIWWYQDRDLTEPKVQVECRLYPQQATNTHRTRALQVMLGRVFSLVKPLSLYAAGEAGFYSHFGFSKYWTAEVYGYSDPEKVEKVLTEILKLFFDLNFDVDEAYFNQTVRHPLQKDLDPSSYGPLYVAESYIDSVLYKMSSDPQSLVKMMNLLGEISQYEVETFTKEFLRDVSLTCSVFGNARKDEAVSYVNIVKNKLRDEGSRINSEDRLALMDVETTKLPKGITHVIRRKTESPTEINSAVMVIFQIDRVESDGGNPDKLPYNRYALTELLGLIMQQSCFNYLRTEKQLGYTAQCDSYVWRGVSYFIYRVQGSRVDAGAKVINREINNHIAQQRRLLHYLAQVPEGRQKLEELKKVLSDKISEKKRTLWEKAYQFGKEVYSPRRDFQRTRKRLDAIAAVTVDDVVEFYDNYIVGSERRKLSSQIYGINDAIPELVEEGEVLIENIETFKETLTETF